MSQWKMTDTNTSAPIWAVAAVNKAPTRANGADFYDNGGTRSKSQTYIYGLSNAEMSGYTNKAHAGWNTETYGAGGIISVTINDGGYGYANGETIFYDSTSVANCLANTTLTLTTNASGNVTHIEITEAGSWTNINQYAGTYTGAGTGLDFSVTMGGRYNRTMSETLVVGNVV